MDVNFILLNDYVSCKKLNIDHFKTTNTLRTYSFFCGCNYSETFTTTFTTTQYNNQHILQPRSSPNVHHYVLIEGFVSALY